VQHRAKGVFGFASNKVNTTYQVNIANVLDDRTIFITKLTTDTVTGARYIQRGFREDPRNTTFTLRVAF
jgi:hypothetical protein